MLITQELPRRVEQGKCVHPIVQADIVLFQHLSGDAKAFVVFLHIPFPECCDAPSASTYFATCGSGGARRDDIGNGRSLPPPPSLHYPIRRPTVSASEAMDVVPHNFTVIQAYFSVRRVVVPPAAVALAVGECVPVVETRTFR
jgi:hypothetical protein